MADALIYYQERKFPFNLNVETKMAPHSVPFKHIVFIKKYPESLFCT
jgi:hypothetical protein